jgi:hypothetical protein
MAGLLGLSVRQLERQLYGGAAIGRRLDRQLEGIDARVMRGVTPPGAPDWLRRRIIAGDGWW